MSRIGFYSGTFDPIHSGHVAFALAAREALMLDEVIFLPEHSPRNKINVSSLEVRIEKIRSVIDIIDGLDVLILGSDKSFSVDSTLPLLHDSYPESSIAFLFGSDVALSIHTWPGFEVLSRFELAIGLRDSQTIEQIENYFAELALVNPVGFQYHVVKTDHSHLSSSHFRN